MQPPIIVRTSRTSNRDYIVSTRSPRWLLSPSNYRGHCYSYNYSCISLLTTFTLVPCLLLLSLLSMSMSMLMWVFLPHAHDNLELSFPTNNADGYPSFIYPTLLRPTPTLDPANLRYSSRSFLVSGTAVAWTRATSCNRSHNGNDNVYGQQNWDDC